jgi:septum formation protein
MRLILASASPRRQQLLRAAGIEFEVQPTDLLETPNPGESPQEFAKRMARQKARAVARPPINGRYCILGADTVVTVNNDILGKPSNPEDAVRMLHLLSGREHQVITGVCLLMVNPLTGPWPVSHLFDFTEDVRAEVTRVSMNELSQDEICSYVASGEPLDKAGAYAIQGVASRWIPRIEGCYFNVVGLPVPLVYRMLREHAAL